MTRGLFAAASKEAYDSPDQAPAARPPNALPGRVQAYVPDPLPPRFTWSDGPAAALKRATEAKRNRVYCAKAVLAIIEEQLPAV